MNIIEAVKSGKPFKRKCWDDWCVRAYVESHEGLWSVNYIAGEFIEFRNTYDDPLFNNLEDLLADDWEVWDAPISKT